MKSKPIILICITACLCFSCFGCVPGEVKEVAGEIDALGEITLDSQSALESVNSKYAALDDQKKEQVENISKLEEANKKYDELVFSAIKKELETLGELEADYFAHYYDLSKLQTVKADAETAINSSNKEIYSDTYSDLKNENESLLAYIEQERAKSYSAQTNDGEHPFMVEESDLPEQWSFKPLAMQTSSHPSWIMGEKKATDLPYWIIPFINGNGREYTYAITQMPTTEITVKDANDQLQTTFVNTQLQLEQYRKEEVNRDPNKELNERPGYFFKDKKGNLILALQNYDGEEYYVLYASN